MYKKVSGIDLTLRQDGSVWIYRNTKNDASFDVSPNGNVSYRDPFGNYMVSYPCKIRINFDPFTLQNYGDEISNSNGTRTIMLSKEEIQEIANKTFYAEGQFHAIDFKTYIITEEEQ